MPAGAAVPARGPAEGGLCPAPCTHQAPRPVSGPCLGQAPLQSGPHYRPRCLSALQPPPCSFPLKKSRFGSGGRIEALRLQDGRPAGLRQRGEWGEEARPAPPPPPGSQWARPTGRSGHRHLLIGLAPRAPPDWSRPPAQFPGRANGSGAGTGLGRGRVSGV